MIDRHLLYILMSIISTIGVDLKIRRRVMKLSQRKLAKISGVNVNTIAFIETNRNLPSLETLVQLGKALNFEVKLVDKEKK